MRNGLLRIVSFANARLGSRAARRPASSGPPPRSTGHAFAGGRSAERSDALRSRKVGASIPRGESGPCDPHLPHNPRRISAPARCRPTASLTRRGFERSERMRCDHFPGTRSGALRRTHDRCGSAASPHAITVWSLSRVGRSRRKPLRRPEKRASGSTSSERAARPLRLARPVAGLRRVFRVA